MSTAVAAIRRRGPLPTWVTAAVLSALSVLIGLASGMAGSAGLAGSLLLSTCRRLRSISSKDPCRRTVAGKVTPPTVALIC